MIKHVYRGIILLCIFVGSLYYFGQDMKEEIFSTQKTTRMSEASFPVVTIRTGTEELNLLHGYSSNLDANMVRESITPLGSEQSFTVVIHENENEVKRVIYELRSVNNNKLLETDTINALEKEENAKNAKIKIKSSLEKELEYAVKITLVTGESKKMNYYTRIKLLPDSYCEEKTSFVMNFHNSIMNKKKAEDIIAFLEPDDSMDTSSLSYVNIHSSFEQVSWGNLKPKLVGELIPTLKEINSDMASVELKYMISSEADQASDTDKVSETKKDSKAENDSKAKSDSKTDENSEYYYVKEYYRVRYTSSRMYLLNYERTMEPVLDLNLANLSNKEQKDGITGQSDMELVTSSDNNKVSFVRQRELWYYDLPENTAVKVFTFRQDNSDYVRDTYAEHDVRILNMDDDGNINFIVYGYMNRGVYEGRVGIVLYKFYSGENRIEEQAYIPMNVTYQMLKEELGSFSYVNQFGTFYFTINRKIYAYNLTTKQLSVIASDINGDNYAVSKEQHYIVWQDSSNPSEAKTINILDLETGDQREIKAKKGENIRLLGKIENNIIYGFTKTKNISSSLDGKVLIPMYKIDIVDNKLNILKEYSKKGYYVTNAVIQDNVITLERMVKNREDGKVHFNQAEPDSILNQITQTAEPVDLTKKITDKTLIKNTVNTVITEDTTLRLNEEDIFPNNYIVYALGDIKGIYDDAGEAVSKADSMFGCVIDRTQQVIWERGVKDSVSEINGIVPVYTNSTTNSVQAAVQMITNYRNGGSKADNSGSNAESAYQLLKSAIGESALNLSGCTLDQVLYYVSKKRPVLAMKDRDNAVLIIGYDAYNITVIDPKLSITQKIGLNDGMAMFQSAGNIFAGYKADQE